MNSTPPGETSQPAPEKKTLLTPALLGWVFAAAGILLLLPRLLQFVQITSAFIAWPWQFDFSEGVNLNAAMQLAAGHNIYHSGDPNGFISAPYPPFFYLLTAPLSWLTGPSLLGGRLLSLMATLAVSVLLAVAVGKATHFWSAGILAGTLWLTFSPVMIWAALYTQHIFALALGLSGLVWVMLKPDARRFAFLVGPLLFALAFFTKQSAVDMAAAATLWLFLRNPKQGFRFGLVLAALVLLPFFAANLLLKGGLWEHTITNQGLPSSGRRFTRLLGRLWGEHWPVLSLGIASLPAVIVALFLSWRKRSDVLANPLTLAMFYFVIAFASVLVRLGRTGVNYNHFIDCLLPACLLFGLALGWLLRSLESRPTTVPNPLTTPRLFAGAGVACLAIVLIAQVLLFTDPHNWYSGIWPDPAAAQQMQSWSDRVAATPGDVFSEDEYLVLSNNKPVIYDDDFMFNTLAGLGKWDQYVFVQSLRDRRFGLVILQSGSTRFTPEASQALDASYTMKVQSSLVIYEPKPVPLSPQVTLTCTLSGLGDTVSLLGYALPPGVAWNGATRGDDLHVTLYWQAANKISGDYATHVQLLNEAGEKVAGQDNPHTASGKPTTDWQPRETVLDSAGLTIPATLPPGRYKLIAGMYQNQNGTLTDLIPTCTPPAQLGNAVTLGWLQIK